MAEFADLIGKVKPARKTVAVCLDGTIAGQLEELQAEYMSHANEGLAPAQEAQDTLAHIKALQAEAAEATHDFVMEAVSASAWRQLMVEHPPPEGDNEGYVWDTETFPPAAIAASCVDPKMTEDDARALFERLSNGQFVGLFHAALDVNNGAGLIPKFAPATSAAPSTAP